MLTLPLAAAASLQPPGAEASMCQLSVQNRAVIFTAGAPAGAALPPLGSSVLFCLLPKNIQHWEAGETV